MIKKIIRFFLGYLIIDIKGNALERLINQIIESGVKIWDLKRLTGGHYQAKIYAYKYKILRPLLRKRMCQIRIHKKRGLPFLFNKARQRVFLLVGIILFFLLLYLGSSFLWLIKIDGLDRIPEASIRQFLSDCGVRPGVYKRSIDLSKLEKMISIKQPGISWIDARWQGTRLYIKIVEKKVIEKTQPGNVYAAKDGQISSLIVLKGTAVVQEGATVTRGQPLILAVDAEKAHGIVEAFVWYEARAESKLYQRDLIYTGERVIRRGMQVKGKTIWFSTIEPSFTNYQIKREIKRLPKWRNIAFPIELVKEEFLEIEFLEVARKRETALYFAKEKALQSLLSCLDDGAVIQQILYENKDIDKNTVSVRVLLETKEDIGE